MTWLNVIAGQLSAADPDNAGAYFANAAAGRAEIKTLIGEVNATLDPVRDGQFIVFHDAYQYFERRFGLQAAGAISFSDASTPSAGRIAELRDAVETLGARCVFAEPQFSRGLVDSVFADRATVGLLDPLGQDLTPGADLYPQVLRGMAAAFKTCLDS